VVIFENLYFTC